MIQAGLVGTGPNWKRFQAALPQLRRSLHISAVYDCTPALASIDSAESVSGLRALAERADIQAILLMDSSWTGLAALELLAISDKPILIADWAHLDLERLTQIHESASDRGITVMPAMQWRYMPASIRLQELMATELGPPIRIRIGADVSEGPLAGSNLAAVVSWIDYCRNLFRSFPESVSFLPSTESENEACLTITYPPLPGEGAKHGRREAEIHFGPSSAIQVECTSGSAVIFGNDHLQWERAEESHQNEQLKFERTEEEITLDLFCRRVVGGLIPVPDCNDLVQAMKALDDVRC